MMVCICAWPWGRMVVPRESCLFLCTTTPSFCQMLYSDGMPFLIRIKRCHIVQYQLWVILIWIWGWKEWFYILELCFSNMSCMYRSHEDLVIRCRLCFGGSWVDPRFGFLNKFPGDVEVAWDRVIFEITDSPPPGTIWTHQQANLWREGSGTGTSGHSAVPYTFCGVPSSSEERGWSWHPSCIISVGMNERI